ncbi:MAG: hypothetical protein ACK5HL_04365 [Bacilli bacterium]
MFETNQDKIKMGLNKEGYKDTMIKPSEYDIYIDNKNNIILKCHNTKTIAIENLSKEKAQEVCDLIIKNVSTNKDYFELPKIENIYFNFNYKEEQKKISIDVHTTLKPRYKNDLPYSITSEEEHLYISLEDTLKDMSKTHYLRGYFEKQLKEKN